MSNSSHSSFAGPAPCPNNGEGSNNEHWNMGYQQQDDRHTPSAAGFEMRRPAHHRRQAHAVSVHYIQAVVKNTFVDVVDPEEVQSRMTRSASDSDLSKSSSDGEKLHFWVPALTSSSWESGGASGGVEETSDSMSITERAVAQVLGSGTAGSQPGASEGPVRVRDSPSGLPGYSDPQLPEVPSELQESARGGNFGRPGLEQSDVQGRQPGGSIDVVDVPLIVQQVHEETGMSIADLMEAHSTHDLSTVPRHYTKGILMSLGSVNHQDGCCNPCMFHATKSCFKGVTCMFCHFRHRDFRVRRVRLPKKKRDKMKAAAERARLPTDVESSSDDEADAACASSSHTAPIGHRHPPILRRGPDMPAEDFVHHTARQNSNTKVRL